MKSDSQLETKITGWLREMGCTPTKLINQTANFELSAPFPPDKKQVMLAVVNFAERPRGVVVAMQLNLDPIHLAAFKSMDNDQRREFYRGMTKLLDRPDTEYAFLHEPGTDILLGYQISAIRYDDGLSLDSLAHTVTSVYKATVASLQFLQQELSDASGGTGGPNFDFKHFNLQ